MSDLSIPGVPGTSKYNTDQIIEDLMRVERIPLQRMEADKSRYEVERSAWQGVNRNLTQLRDSSRSLFSFENPFHERIASSSDESVLTAIANRTALEETANVIVKSVAGRDRFSSDSLDRSHEVAEGKYRFAVGDREVSFTFRGGSLATFARTINERTGDLLRARVIGNTSTTNVFVIEALETGAANTLRFLDDSAEFGIRTGLVKAGDDTFRSVDVDRTTIRALATAIDDQHVEFSDDGTVVLPESSISIPLSPTVAVNERLVMDITYSMTRIPYEYTPPTPPPGPSTPGVSSVEFQGIVIQGESSRVISPQWSPPKPPEKRDDLGVFSLATDSGEVELRPIVDNEGRRTIRVPLADYTGLLSGLNVRNDNTHRTILVESVKVFDPTSRGEYQPKHPIETASDAVVMIDGIEVTRDSNQIDDLIAGVTLNLKSAGDTPVTLTIEPDRQAVKDAIISFVGYYNQLLTEINILTSRSEEVVNEIGYFSDVDREKALERLGLLQGDITVMQLKSRLQTVMMNAYPGEYSLLDQIGISTNPTRSGGGVDRSRLRGYMDIDEKRLDAALESKMGSVRKLFGHDTDGDLLVDTGVAFTFDSYIKPYVETGGFIPSKVSTIGTRISDAVEDIENFETKLERVEQKYREDYGAMEAALQNLERSSQQLDNFSRSNSGN